MRHTLLAVALVVTVAAPAAAQPTEMIEYYRQDIIGSIRIVFAPNGTVLGRQDYEPFGQPLFTAPGMPREGFGAQERDQEADQTYLHARMLQNRTGRFTRPDPIRGNLGSPQRWNRYTYARNNPMSRADLGGLDDYCVICIDYPGGEDDRGPGDSDLPGRGGSDERDGEKSPKGDPGDTGGGGTDQNPTPNPNPPNPPRPAPPPTPPPSPPGEEPPGTKSIKWACAADVGLNFAAGFVPGFNGLKVLASYNDVQFNPVQWAAGSDRPVSAEPDALSLLTGLSSTTDLFARASYSASEHARYTDLASRDSFADKSPAKQQKILGKLASLSRLAKIASIAGTAANLFNAASAVNDLMGCRR